MRKWIAGIVCFVVLGASAAFAADKTLCTPIELKSADKNIALQGPEKGQPSRIYFIKNMSSKSIWIDHVVTQASASAGWATFLHAGHWSAFLLNRKNFLMSCAVILPGKVDYLDCKKAVSVCVPKTVSMDAISRKSTYWLAEDKSWDDLLKALAKRKVVVPVQKTN